MRRGLIVLCFAATLLAPAAGQAEDAGPAVPAPPTVAPVAPVAKEPCPSSAAEPRAIPDPSPWIDVAGATLAGVSGDGHNVYFRMSTGGVSQLFRVGHDGGWPRRLTFRRDGPSFVVPSPSGVSVVLGYDHSGDENHGLYLRSTAIGAPERLLEDRKDVQHGSVVWSEDGRTIYFHSNAASPSEFAVCSLDAGVGSAVPTTVLDRPGRWEVEDVDREGKRLLVSLERSARARSLYVLTLATGELTEIDPPKASEEVLPEDAHFVGDGTEALFLSDRGGEWRQAFVVRLSDGVVRPLLALDADVESATVSRDRRTAALVVNRAGGTEVVVVDIETGERRPSPGTRGGIASGPAFDDAGSLYFTLTRSDTPGTVVRFDPATEDEVELTVPDYAGLDPAQLDVSPRLVKYRSFDGREIPAWLYLPRVAAGKEPKGLPFLLQLHGGPTAQERPGFSAERAYLLSLGFGVLAPNVRGSSGYGKTYRDLDDGRRRMDAVKDAKAAVDWLVAEGYADPRRVACMGGSYGGFLVLALLVEYPQMFAAGAEVVGIANFETFLQRTAPYRRAHRESEYGSLADRELLRAISPIHKVDRIAAPLLIGHGENDPRVPVEEARQIEAAMKAKGRPVEAIYFKDEGHGFRRRENRILWTRRLAEFLVRSLGQP